MKSGIKAGDFQVPSGTSVSLKKWPTLVKPFYNSKKQYVTLLQDHVQRLSELQQVHYASQRYAVLLIFQEGRKPKGIHVTEPGMVPFSTEVGG
jgi:hypothetical protein